ncbi:MAG: hypothetical protein NT167_27220 [Verrucomicrobia bacterium]|nr:hypothetical protein [Verrucomicrobiota bacterium]
MTGILRNIVELCVVLVFMRETPANENAQRRAAGNPSLSVDGAAEVPPDIERNRVAAVRLQRLVSSVWLAEFVVIPSSGENDPTPCRLGTVKSNRSTQMAQQKAKSKNQSPGASQSSNSCSRV